MTRLEASNEPSMEDILASIRKIIAEDPPGSRPVPQQPAARTAPAASPAPSSFGRAPMRELSAREPQFSTEPATAPADITPEPYLRSTPTKSETSSFGSAPFFTPKSEPKPLASRIEPSFSAMSALAPAPAAVFEPTPAALSVDAQLSDLLGEVAPAPAAQSFEQVTAAAPASPELAVVVKPSVDFAAKLIGRPGPAPLEVPAQAEARPGFSVSRDGFVPEKAGADGDADAGRDPFEFDLGPSPFEPKAAAVQHSRATVSGDPIFDGQEPPAQAEPEFARAPEPDQMTAPIAAVAVEPAAILEEQPADLSFVSGPLPYVAPSVEATVQPPAPALEPELAPVHAAATPDPVIAVTEPVAVEEVVPELEPHPVEAAELQSNAGTDDKALPIRAVEMATGPMAQAMQQSMQMTLPSATQRSMEDTVADLLRPMLKSWLAENMPKIVERALRRELTEQLHSEHKAAAE
jgi:cell pole-organizing protein PopZ